MYKTEEGKKKVKELMEIDLMELRRVPQGTSEEIKYQPAPKQAPVTRKKKGPGRKTLQEPPTKKDIDRKNAEINEKNALLMKNRVELFSFFVQICVSAVLSHSVWEKSHKKKKLSEFATATDESFAMILFENNAEIFKALGDSGIKTNTEMRAIDKYKNVLPRWTAGTGKNVGWDEEGMDRFEKLVRETIINRQSTDDNKKTYVDMDSKFYNMVKKDNTGGPVITLNAPKARKKKRRFTELR